MENINKIVPFYKMLVYLILFILVKKFLDIIIQIKYPTFDNVRFDKQPILWRYLLYLSNISYVFVFIFVLFFLFNYKLNGLILFFLYLLLFKVSYYFLIDYKYIYLFISKDKYSNIIDKLDTVGDDILDSIVFLCYIYILYRLLIS